MDLPEGRNPIFAGIVFTQQRQDPQCFVLVFDADTLEELLLNGHRRVSVQNPPLCAISEDDPLDPGRRGIRNRLVRPSRVIQILIDALCLDEEARGAEQK